MTNILLVMRNPFEASLTRDALAAGGPGRFAIAAAPCAGEALALLASHRPDVVLLDLGNEEPEGRSAFEPLETLSAATRAPIVVMVERGSEALAEHALQRGARDYLVKHPGRSVLIERVVAHALESERLARTLAQTIEREQDLREVLDGLFATRLVGIAIADREGRIERTNDAWRETLGGSEADWVGRSIADVAEPQARDEVRTLLDRLRDGTVDSMGVERRFAHRDGHPVWARLRASVVPAERDKRARLVLELRDTSWQRWAEEELRLSREESRQILETAHDAFVRMNADGTICDWNLRAETMFGWKREEVVGRPLAEVVMPEASADLLGLDRYLASGDSSLLNRRVRVSATHRDGHEFPAEIGVWISSRAPLVFNALITDITERARAEEALRRSERRFRAVYDGTAMGILILDLQGRVIAANAALQRMLAYSADEMGALPWEALVHPEDLEIGNRERADLLAGRCDRFEVERRYRRKDGALAWLRMNVSLVRDGSGAPDFAVGVCEDVTERRLTELALRNRTVQLLELVAAASNEAGSVEEALQICITHVCEKMGWPLGHAYLAHEGALVHTPVWHLADPGRYASFRDVTMSMRFTADGGFPGRTLTTGKPIWIPDFTQDPRLLRSGVASRAGLRSAVCFPVLIGGRVAGALEFLTHEPMRLDPIVADAMAQIGIELGHVIERKRMEANIAYQAMHDGLTSLPNRTLFMDRLQQALARLDRSRAQMALLFIDVDGFKEVNDALGHVAGDQLLVALSSRLRAVLRPGDTVARLGGDEFTAVCEGIGDGAEAVAIADRVMAIMTEPFQLKGGDRLVTVSVGIALASRPEENPDLLLRNADTAMYRAKESGGGRYVMFDEALRAQVQRRRGRERALLRAIEHGELRLVYQPGITLRSRSIAGLEALVRWQHPERGLLPSQEIIPLAEESGLIVPLGHWVLDEACRQVAHWRENLPGAHDLHLWVNLSSRQLADGALSRTVDDTLRRVGLVPDALSLEVTESVLLDDEGPALRELDALHELGIQLSIDDFGSGYSSLSYLRRIPIVDLKLDRSLVEDLGGDPQATAIAAAVINLAHALDLRVVAEGVETKRQLEQLQALECDCGQGFYFARPQPAEDMEPLLTAGGF